MLAGDGTCSGASDGIAVAGLALDAAAAVLYFSDPVAGQVRALDLATKAMHPVAGGGVLLGADSEGKPATQATLRPQRLTLSDGWLHVSDAQGNRVVRVSLSDGSLFTDVHPATDRRNCTDSLLSDCVTASCRPVVDPGGTVFVGGQLCIASLGLWFSPGILRLDSRAPSLLGGLADQLKLVSIPVMAFDAAGNLFTFSGNVLSRLDGATTAITQLNDSKAPGGNDGPISAATFASPRRWPSVPAAICTWPTRRMPRCAGSWDRGMPRSPTCDCGRQPATARARPSPGLPDAAGVHGHRRRRCAAGR